MINAKQVYGTYPHVQMRWYIEILMRDQPASKKAHALGRLTSKYVYNCNEQCPDKDHVEADIDMSFTWGDTEQGHDFWSEVNRIGRGFNQEFAAKFLKGEKRVKPKELKAKIIPEAAPRKRVGWWT